MHPKSKTSNFELLVPTKVVFYFQKYGTDEKVSAIDTYSISAKKHLLVRNTILIIAYWKTVCEYARGIRYVVASFNQIFKVRAINV